MTCIYTKFIEELNKLKEGKRGSASKLIEDVITGTEQVKLNKEQVDEAEQGTLYSKLGNKTATGNVVLKSVHQKAGIQYAKSIGGVFSLRIEGSQIHFGNPFSSVKTEIDKGLIATKSTKESVEKYMDWVMSETTEIEPNRHAWIREQIKSGKLKGKKIVYYKELNEPSHATGLDYLINNSELAPVAIKGSFKGTPKEDVLNKLGKQLRSSLKNGKVVSGPTVGPGEVLKWGARLTKTYTNVKVDPTQATSYEYSRKKHTLANKVPEPLRSLQKDVEQMTGKDAGYYNHILVNVIDPGGAMASHQDNESLYWEEGSTKSNPIVGDVAVVSIGDTVSDHTISNIDYPVSSMSVVEFNGNEDHKVGKAGKDGRISITFRHIPYSKLIGTSAEQTDQEILEKAKQETRTPIEQGLSNPFSKSKIKHLVYHYAETGEISEKYKINKEEGALFFFKTRKSAELLKEGLNAGKPDTKGKIFTAYINLQNAPVVDASMMDTSTLVDQTINAKNNNQDGVIATNMGEHLVGVDDQYGVFDLNNVKFVEEPNVVPTKQDTIADIANKYKGQTVLIKYPKYDKAFRATINGEVQEGSYPAMLATTAKGNSVSFIVDDIEQNALSNKSVREELENYYKAKQDGSIDDSMSTKITIEEGDLWETPTKQDSDKQEIQTSGEQEQTTNVTPTKQLDEDIMDYLENTVEDQLDIESDVDSVNESREAIGRELLGWAESAVFYKHIKNKEELERYLVDNTVGEFNYERDPGTDRQDIDEKNEFIYYITSLVKRVMSDYNYHFARRVQDSTNTSNPTKVEKIQTKQDSGILTPQELKERAIEDSKEMCPNGL